jgi:general stress protein 26
MPAVGWGWVIAGRCSNPKEESMGDVKDLAARDAIVKMREIAEGEIAMLCTFAALPAMHTRPMGTSAIDDDGTFWFLSAEDSGKNREIAANPIVQLVYSVPSKSAFLAVQGTAAILRDQKKIDQVWNPLAKAWFHEGKDDPRITLLRVRPMRGHYWDTKHNKMVALAEIALGALIGKTLDDGIEGTLRV